MILQLSPLPDRCWPTFVNDPSKVYGFEDIANTQRHLQNLLGHAPLPDEQPRIERKRKAFEQIGGVSIEVRAVCNARTYDPHRHSGYARVMRENHVPTVLVEDGEAGDPVDRWIREQIDAIGECGHAVLWAHDGGYGAHLTDLLLRGGHVSLIGFTEHFSWKLTDLVRLGARFFDAEHDLRLWNIRLPNRPDAAEIKLMRPYHTSKPY